MAPSCCSAYAAAAGACATIEAAEAEQKRKSQRGRLIQLIVIVDKDGIVLGRNGSNLMRGEDLGAVYPSLKAALAKKPAAKPAAKAGAKKPAAKPLPLPSP